MATDFGNITLLLLKLSSLGFFFKIVFKASWTYLNFTFACVSILPLLLFRQLLLILHHHKFSCGHRWTLLLCRGEGGFVKTWNWQPRVFNMQSGCHLEDDPKACRPTVASSEALQIHESRCESPSFLTAIVKDTWEASSLLQMANRVCCSET